MGQRSQRRGWRVLAMAATVSLLAVPVAAPAHALLPGVPADPGELLRPLVGQPGDEARGNTAYADVRRYSSFPGFPRSGTPGGQARAGWIAGELAAAGFAVHTEPFTIPRFDTSAASLKVGAFKPKVMPLYYSGATPPGGVTAEIVHVGLGTPLDLALTDVAGKIAVIDAPTVQNSLAPTAANALDGVRAAGARGAVIAFRGPANHIAGQNVDPREGHCNLPTLVVGKQDGNALRAMTGQRATLVLDARIQDATIDNIVATLPGTGPDVVVVGTPYNGWFTSAAERGSGIGVFLTLARQYGAQAAKGQRPAQTLVFVGLAGHELGLLGLQQYIARNRPLLDRVTAYVHIGATVAAKHYVEIGTTIVETGLPEVIRSAFVSENPLLLLIAERALRLNRTGVFTSVPPSVQNPGEQQFMYRAGVPIVSMSGGHLYFHTPGDVPATTSASLIGPMVSAFGQIVDDLLASDRTAVRSANVIAETVGSGAGAEHQVGITHRCR